MITVVYFVSFFLFFLQPLNNVKTILSMRAVQK